MIALQRAFLGLPAYERFQAFYQKLFKRLRVLLAYILVPVPVIDESLTFESIINN
jgi:hypothetical protein